MPNSRLITDIKLQEKRKDRFSIFLEHEFAFGIHQDVLLKSGIARGDSLSQEKVDAILKMELVRNAREKALRLLAHRARSKKELRDRLTQAGYEGQVVDDTIADMERLRLVNDSEFSVMYSRNRMITKPVGEFLLRRELQQKGILEADINKGVEEAYREKSEYQAAKELAIRNKKKQVKLDEDKAKKRVTDFLMRRGFHWDLVKGILEDWELLDE
jgi:regulatory protein